MINTDYHRLIQVKCQAYGKGWDLAVIESAEEMSLIDSKITDGCAPYWTGMTEENGTLFGLDGKTKIKFAPWDGHLGKQLRIGPI